MRHSSISPCSQPWLLLSLTGVAPGDTSQLQITISGEGKGYPLPYSVLENSMVTVYGVTKSRTRLSDWAHTAWVTWFMLKLRAMVLSCLCCPCQQTHPLFTPLNKLLDTRLSWPLSSCLFCITCSLSLLLSQEVM